MKADFTQRSVLVSLPIRLVEALLAAHAELGGDLSDALKFSVSDGFASAREVASAVDVLPQPAGKYVVEFLGAQVAARTLPAIFSQIVDLMAEVAPEALDALASMSARTRRFIAVDPHVIHPGNQNLPVMQTSSGWWISKNIGREDLERAMRALCCASGLAYGSDLKFSVSSGL